MTWSTRCGARSSTNHDGVAAGGRELGASALAIVVAIGAMGAARLFHGGLSSTRVAAGPPVAGSGPPLTGGDPRAISGGPVPSLTRLFALPACNQDPGGLTSWTVDALAPYLAVDPAAARPAAVLAAAAVVPVPAVTPPGGACADAVTAGGAYGWQLRASDGSLLGRGAGAPLTSRTVPSRLTAQRAIYHQESVASGQPFSGVVDGSRAEGLTSTGVVVVDAPMIPTSGADAHAAGMQLLAGLSFASVSPLGLDVAFRVPAVAPAGFTRCTGDVGYLRQAGGTVVDFCDAAGRTITAGWDNRSTAATTGGRPVDVRGFPGTVSDLPGKRPSVSVDIPGPGTTDLHAHVDGFVRVDTDQLVDMLRSVGALDPRVLRPRAGTNDLTSLVTDADRLRGLLEAAGATGVSFPPPRPCATVATAVLPCPLPSAITLTVPAGSTATLVDAVVRKPEETFAGLLPQATGVETVSGIDVLERDATGIPGPPDAAQQALFVCGGVQFNFLGREVFSFARALIPHLAC